MNARTLLACLYSCVVGLSVYAAEEAPKKQATNEEIQARLAEHARKKSAPTPAPAAAKPAPAPAKTKAVTANAAQPAPVAPAVPKPADEPAAVLPRVDVRKDRVTELDRQLEKQNQEMAREKKNTKPTPLDETLNSPKTSKMFALFGGQSSEDRSNIAKERVSMMEEERDMIEAIAQATSKEEKEELQKTLDSMKTMRRELERSLR